MKQQQQQMEVALKAAGMPVEQVRNEQRQQHLEQRLEDIER